MVKKPVSVYIRTRPTANFSQDQILIDAENNSIRIKQRLPADKQHMDNKRDSWNFRFNKVMHNFGQDTTYDEVAEDIVRGCVDGINATIMAYGQTGAGKTFTMTGDTSNYKNRGIIPRAVAQLFQDISDRPQHEFKVSCSYMEIYNERIFDLLDDNPKRDVKEYTITEDPETRTVQVRGLTYESVDSEEGALNLLFRGEKNRIIAEHNLNKKSNRSHSIFTLHIEQKSRVRSEEVLCSKLNLVDLAGSERLKKAIETEGYGYKHDETLRKESMYINKSLTYLEQVVVALTGKNRNHIPYRQTKLTNILKDSLGGNCNTALVACIWGESSHIDETISTLKLAQRMMRVENQTSRNVQTDPLLQIKRYERIIRELKQELMMHDALANRSGISYEDFTPEECTDIADKVRKYVDASPEDEEKYSIDISSVRQIRECFHQFKLLVKNVESEVEERLKKQFVFQTKESKDQDSESSGSLLNNQREVENKDGYVGEHEDGTGYSLGIAPPNARPDSIEAGQSFEQIPDMEGKVSDNELGNVISRSYTNQVTKELEIQPKIPTDREQAFRVYITTNQSGITLHQELENATESIKVLVEKLQETRLSMKRVQVDLERHQQGLDSVRAEQKVGESKQYTDEEIIDEEEFLLLKNIKLLKQEFRKLRESFNELKTMKKTKQMEQEHSKSKLLCSFKAWHQEQQNDDEDVLDDGEQFEKLEIERVLAKDPESVAFFKAAKANKSKQRRSPNIPRR